MAPTVSCTQFFHFFRYFMDLCEKFSLKLFAKGVNFVVIVNFGDFHRG